MRNGKVGLVKGRKRKDSAEWKLEFGETNVAMTNWEIVDEDRKLNPIYSISK